MLRFVEGIGVALYITAAYTVAAKLYPDSTGLAIVSQVATAQLKLYLTVADLTTGYYSVISYVYVIMS